MTNRIATVALELRRRHGSGLRHVASTFGKTPLGAPAMPAKKPAQPAKKTRKPAKKTATAPVPVEVRAEKPWPSVAHDDPSTQWAAWITLLVNWRDRAADDVQSVVGKLGDPFLTLLKQRRAPDEDDWAELLAGLGLGRRPLSRSTIAHWEELLRRHGPIVALLPVGLSEEDDMPGVMVVGLSGDGTPAGTEVQWIDPRSGEVRSVSFAVFQKASGTPSADGEKHEVLLWPPGERLACKPAAMALRIEPGWSAALNYSPGDRDNPCTLEWKNLTLTKGSDGRKHLYYLVTGGPKGKAQFDLQVTNGNDHYNFRDQKVSISLKAVGKAGSPKADRVVPLAGQKAGSKYKSWKRPGELEDEHSETITFHIDSATLRKAYDPDHPLTRIDAEYRWVEGAIEDDHGYQTTSLGFFLVEPVNLMWTKAREIGEVRLDDPKKHFEYWVGLTERRFGKEDEAPIQVTGSIRYTVSAGESATVRADAKVSTTKGKKSATEVGGTIGGKRSTGASLEFPLKKIFNVGISASNELSGSVSFKKLEEVTKSQTREFLQSVSSSRSFTSSLTKEHTVSVKLEPGRPGELRRLYAYPIFRLHRMPLVLFEANAYGQAGVRREVAHFPVLKLSHWGFHALGEKELPPIKR
ncbi:MAG: papain-like cysteine protease family protein [Myxococcales bacterium]|jgi:hypothetical protein